MWDTVKEVFTGSMAVANATGISALLIVMVREISVSLLRRKINFKDTNIDELRNEIIEIHKENGDLKETITLMSELQTTVVRAINTIGDMVNTAYENSQLDASVKRVIRLQFADLLNLTKVTAVNVIDEVTGDETVKTIVQEAIDIAKDIVPEYLRGITSE